MPKHPVKFHLMGLACLLSGLGYMGVAYSLYQSGSSYMSYRMGPISYGTFTMLGIVLTIGAGLLFGFFLYVHALVQRRKPKESKDPDRQGGIKNL